MYSSPDICSNCADACCSLCVSVIRQQESVLCSRHFKVSLKDVVMVLNVERKMFCTTVSS